MFTAMSCHPNLMPLCLNCFNFYLLLVAILLSLVSIPYVSATDATLRKSQVPFSGFYFPDISTSIEPFASAWLTSKKKFVSSKKGITDMQNFEGTVFAIIGQSNYINVHKKTIMTRDYFDFQVEHLSPTTNTLENYDLYDMLGERLNKRADALRLYGLNNTEQHPFGSSTVAIIPFSTKGVSSEGSKVRDIRISMFLATFWSLRRYNFEIVVSVSSDSELAALNGLNLPIFSVYKFYDLQKKSDQAKLSLLHALEDIGEKSTWQKFEFVYYTDADQILHMRNLNTLYQTLSQDKAMVLCPHRLQTMVLPKDVPKIYRENRHFKIEEIIHRTKSATLIQEKGITTRGSCCDDGRYVITKSSSCHNFWYFCPGLHEYTMAEWIKFGPYGITAPLTTEHMGKCRYHPNRRQCDVPKNCDQSTIHASDGSKICDEIPKAFYFA